MEPLEEATLKEFCERLAASGIFSGVDLARLAKALSGDVKPKADDVIAVLRDAADAFGGLRDDSN